jgi:hypothetical protein
VILARKQADELVDREGLPLDLGTAYLFAPLFAAALEQRVLACDHEAEFECQAKRLVLLERQAAWAVEHRLGNRQTILARLEHAARCPDGHRNTAICASAA